MRAGARADRGADRDATAAAAARGSCGSGSALTSPPWADTDSVQQRRARGESGEYECDSVVGQCKPARVGPCEAFLSGDYRYGPTVAQ